jgi:hypothetical protein
MITTGCGDDSKYDKGARWISLSMEEIENNDHLTSSQKDKISTHLNELTDNEELRTDLNYLNKFIEELKNEDYPDSAILSLTKCHVRVSSPLNSHDGYWVSKVKAEGTPFKVTIVNDMHIDPYTKRVTVYAQTQLFGKPISPAQVDPGEFTTDRNGNKIAHHPNSVYLNGSGKELTEADGTGEWWVKHSWQLDGEGYRNWELELKEDYGEGVWAEAILLEDGITMKIGTLEGELKGYNTRGPVFNGDKLGYTLTRWEYLNNDTLPTEMFTLEFEYKTTKSAFDNLARKPVGE